MTTERITQSQLEALCARIERQLPNDGTPLDADMRYLCELVEDGKLRVRHSRGEGAYSRRQDRRIKQLLTENKTMKDWLVRIYYDMPWFDIEELIREGGEPPKN